MKLYHTLIQLMRRKFLKSTPQELERYGNPSFQPSVKPLDIRFAVPMLKPTYSILDCTIQEVRNIDTKARKVLSMTGNFHINSDVDCLYIPRSGGRGLKAKQTAYECAIVSLNHHLTRNKDRSQLLSIVCQSKENERGRVAGELCCKYDITISQNELPGSVGQKCLRSKYKENISFYQNKVMHGCIAKSIENNPTIKHQNCGQEIEIRLLNLKHVLLLSKTKKLLRNK